jgi:uncharacterized protein (DUF1697 family)
MRHVILLRGINLGPSRRIAMPELRKLLGEASYRDVATYVQSGNVVLTSGEHPDEVADDCERLIGEHFGFEVPVMVRTAEELADVISRNPLPEATKDPKRYQVTFLDRPLDPERIEELAQLATPSERFAASGRELYGWHPQGASRSKLWNRLASKNLGVRATARNWTTVTTLLEMARA